MQIISEKSEKIYKIGKKSDPCSFLIWLIDNLARSIKKEKKKFNLL
jgi:hypothetical protein